MMNPAKWRSYGVVLGWQRPLSSQGLVEGGGPSSSQKCLSGRLRCKQLPSDYLFGMRGRVVCHQHCSERKNHPSDDM